MKILSKILALAFPLIKDEDNEAVGEIKKFTFDGADKRELGKQILSDETDKEGQHYDTIWVHVGLGYYKCIGKWKESRTC
jgi:hypothetical protein